MLLRMRGINIASAHQEGGKSERLLLPSIVLTPTPGSDPPSRTHAVVRLCDCERVTVALGLLVLGILR